MQYQVLPWQDRLVPALPWLNWPVTAACPEDVLSEEVHNLSVSENNLTKP